MAKFCVQCGSEIIEGKKFCTECGAAAETAAEKNFANPQQPAGQQYSNNPPQQPDADAPPPKGSKYEPVTTMEFICISLLMFIPIVNLILLVVWALGGCKKINKRNMARASLIMMVVSLIISLFIGMAVKAVFNKALKEAGIAYENGEFVVLEEESEIGRLMDSFSAITDGELTTEDIAGIFENFTGEEIDTAQFEELLGGIADENGEIDMEQLQKMLEQFEEAIPEE